MTGAQASLAWNEAKADVEGHRGFLQSSLTPRR